MNDICTIVSFFCLLFNTMLRFVVPLDCLGSIIWLFYAYSRICIQWQYYTNIPTGRSLLSSLLMKDGFRLFYYVVDSWKTLDQALLSALLLRRHGLRLLISVRGGLISNRSTVPLLPKMQGHLGTLIFLLSLVSLFPVYHHHLLRRTPSIAFFARRIRMFMTMTRSLRATWGASDRNYCVTWCWKKASISRRSIRTAAWWSLTTVRTFTRADRDADAALPYYADIFWEICAAGGIATFCLSRPERYWARRPCCKNRRSHRSPIWWISGSDR